MNRKKSQNTLLRVCPLLLCVLLTGIGYAVFMLAQASNKPAETVPTQTLVPIIETTLPATEEPSTEATTAETTTEPPTTEPPKPTLGRVEENYFDDALFIGDSRTDGLRLYSTLSDNADFYCATSMSIFGIMDSDASVNGVTGIRNVLQAKQYGKIYIMFGINEAGYDTDSFLSQYEEVIEELRGYQPEAIIYIQGIMYVTAAKAANEPVFSNDGLREKNAGLKELANDTDIFYLEVNENLDDGNGNLPSDYTGDGVHLKASYYSLWRDYLLDHALVTEAMHYSPEA